MARRQVRFYDRYDDFLFVLWVSVTQDCGHEVFQINTKDEAYGHRFTSFCKECGIRKDVTKEE